jgi:hypothetical protein
VAKALRGRLADPWHKALRRLNNNIALLGIRKQAKLSQMSKQTAAPILKVSGDT